MKIGIVGAELSGKSTLFTALTGIAREPGPFTLQPVPGVVRVPDERLEWLRELYNPKKYSPATLNFLDYPGIGGSRKSEIIAGVRDCDALLVVLRDFESPTVPSPEKGVDPARELEDLKVDFLISDLDVIERRIAKLKAGAGKPSKTKEQDERELAVLTKVRPVIEEGRPWDALNLNPDDYKMLNCFRFLTQKPMILVVNVGMKDIEGGKTKAYSGSLKEAIVLCAEIEKEIAQLEPADQKPFLADLGLSEAVAGRLVKKTFSTLNLCSFFTVGEDEVRSWTIARGDTAIVAAGKIHSDIARGFIRAEMTPFEKMREAGTLREVKARNLVILESKDYVVQDGDIVHFRFSV